MNITVVGAGNIGTQFAVHCAEKKHNVIIYGSKPEKISKELTIVNENDEVIHKGTISGATSNPEEAFSGADVVFVTMPAFCMKSVADTILPYANPEMKICLIPGTGGGECAFKDCFHKGAVIFGLQRVPSVARLCEYGKTVRATGYRDELFVSAIPNSATEECRQIVGSIFDSMKCSALPMYLNLTLTPSNPILHTTRLRVLYKEYKDGFIYDSVPLFYEGWTDETSELLFKCDEEVQEMCRRLDCFDLSYVKSLRIHYESATPEALTRKIQSIKGFKGITSPCVKVEGGYIPDLNSRYFTADFPYGLSILVQLADLLEMDAPYMKATLDWYYDIAGKKDEFRFSDYGINSLDEFIKFYSE